MTAQSLRHLSGGAPLGEAKRTVEALIVYSCISLIVDEVKHLPVHFLATWVSSSTKACSSPPSVLWVPPPFAHEERLGKSSDLPKVG